MLSYEGPSIKNARTLGEGASKDGDKRGQGKRVISRKRTSVTA